MYVRMYVHMYMYTYVHMYVCMYVVQLVSALLPCLSGDGLLHRTATVYKTNEPFWGEEYTLHIPTEFQTMAVYIYNVDQIMG